MLFLDLAKELSKLEQESSRLKMMSIVSNIFEKTTTSEIDTLIYLLLGQFGARFKELDLGVADKTIIAALSRSTGLDKERIEKEYRELGDLGLVGEKLVKSKIQKKLFSKKIDISEVYSLFKKIALAEGKGAIAEKINYLSNLINNSSPLEVKYIIRIAQKNMRLGLSTSTIIDALSLFFLDSYKKQNQLTYKHYLEKYGQEEADRYLRYDLKSKIEAKYNIFPDLGTLAKKMFSKGIGGLYEIEITLFVPVLPALAERLPTIEKVVEKLGTCYVEPKYDGFRLQCHYDGEKVKLFTRNLEDMSDLFPDAVKTIKKAVKKYPIIFECEAIGYNKKENKYYPFQVTIKRKRKYDIEDVSKQIPLRLVVFDIMYLNKSLIDLPFEERRKILRTAIKESADLVFPKGLLTKDPKKIREYFVQVLSEGNEGIMLKDPKASYTAGARKFAWVKYKKSYSSKASDTLDLVIMGYFSGKGQRSKFGIGALLVGCRNKKTGKIETVAKVGSGLTEASLEEINVLLEKIRVPKKPEEYFSDLVPDFWVYPKYVVEIFYDEITKSPVHTCAKEELGGLALRFPRFARLRSDKDPESTNTTEEIISLFNAQ